MTTSPTSPEAHTPGGDGVPELLPCPFCGGEARVVEGDESAYIQCTQMKMHRAIFFSGDNDAVNEVVTQWNRRVLIGPSFAQKTALNAEFQRLYDAGMAEGKHGHYETMFAAMHGAYATVAPSRPDHEALIERLRAYATDWRERAASKDIIDEAIAALSSHRPPAPAPLEQKETDGA